MNFRQDIVLLFTRFPVPGLSKTRLIPVLGEKGAAELQKKMTQQAVEAACQLMADNPCSLEIHYAGGDIALMQDWLGKAFTYKRQADGDIGFKMLQAMEAHLGDKRSILLFGSDLPHITRQILAEALEAAQTHDLVLGPASDGGYYLIGVNGGVSTEVLTFLFSDIPWGSSAVFTKTMAKAHQQFLSTHILPELHDIDRPEDLGYLHHRPHPQ